MNVRRRIIALSAVGIIVIVASVWYLVERVQSGGEDTLAASGTVEAQEVAVSPQMPGQAVEVLVREGERVSAGDVLLRLDDAMLQAQRRRAESALQAARAAVSAAEANLELAKAGLQVAQANLDAGRLGVEAARIQYESALQAARAAQADSRTDYWEADQPAGFELPGWYFTVEEDIQSAEGEMKAAQDLLRVEQQHYDRLVGEIGQEVQGAEARLVKARMTFLVAGDLLEQVRGPRDAGMEDYVQARYDAARSELESAQADYDLLLSDQRAEDLLDARSRLAVARENEEIARDRYDRLLTGTHALPVQAADTALRQAEAAVAIAEASLSQAERAIAQAEQARLQAEQNAAQAQAELDLIDVQIDRMTVRAAVDGVVLTRNVQPGEVLQAGATAFTLGRLDNLTITVYIPEDRYGQLSIGMPATVKVDSFPDERFSARVVRIADRAEFTPRNVSTEDGRRTTVFAVDLAVESPEGRLKPGMPADVEFE